MFFRNTNFQVVGRKLISTNPVKCTLEAVKVSKRNDYYKHLGEETVNEKPADWVEALPYKSLPGPKPLPLIGNIWRFLPYVGEYYNLPLQTFYQMLRDKYGDIVNIKGIVGRKPMVMLFKTDDMENHLRNAGPFPIRYGLESFAYYRTKTRKDIFKGVGGVMSVQGEEWFKVRSVINPILMQPRMAQQYVSRMDMIAGELVDNMRYFSMQNERREMPDDFINELYKWGLESIGVVALDKHLGCLKLNLDKESEQQKLITSVIEMFNLMYKLDILPPTWKLISTPSWRKFLGIMDFITQTCLKHIEEALESPVDENTSEQELSVIKRLAKQDKAIAITMVMDMMIAGIDTTGKTIAAALYFLARNPEKQEKLREELLKNMPDKSTPITQQMLSNSPYLKAVVKETIRIAPIAVGNLRTTIKDMVLGGYQIPKNTEVLTMNLLSAADPLEFKEPDTFIPERWLRITADEYSFKNAHPFAYLPFGFGPRSCVGKRFANLELEVGISKIIRNFELSWPHEDMVFSATLLYGVASPLKLKVKPFKGQ